MGGGRRGRRLFGAIGKAFIGLAWLLAIVVGTPLAASATVRGPRRRADGVGMSNCISPRVLPRIASSCGGRSLPASFG